MTAPTNVITRLATVERQAWTYDSPIGEWISTAGRLMTGRDCPAVVVPNLNTSGGPSARPPRNPAPPRPLRLDMLPVRLTHRDGQWLAVGRFTHPAALEPFFAALLDPGNDYLLTSYEDDVVVTADPGRTDPQSA